MLFYFFMCDDLSFINTTQKTLKPSKKMFQCPGWMRISPSQQYNLPTKITISDSPPAKTFLKFLPPPPPQAGRGACMPWFSCFHCWTWSSKSWLGLRQMLSMKLWLRFRSFSVLSRINQDNEFAKDKCQSCQPAAKYSILQPKDSKFDKVLNLYYETGSYYSFSRNERPELLR